MKYYHGRNKISRFYEGWYFKQHQGEESISFIPGVQMDENSCSYAFIQVITKEESHFFKYPIRQFYAEPNVFFVRIGNNIFTKQGVYIDIHQENHRKEKVFINGYFQYKSLTPLNYSIMGPFQCLPLPCKHGIISMRHKVSGNVQINEKSIVIKEGVGYIETDYGSSFPRNYFWTQANARKDTGPQIFVAIATIPMCHWEFLGCIALIQFQGKQYRFATYLGAKILIIKDNLAVIQQRRWTLCIHMAKDRRPQDLIAPCNGNMKRIIKEDLKCVVRYTLYHGSKKVFDWTTRNASLEFVASKKNNSKASVARKFFG